MAQTNPQFARVRLMTLDPGHFHSSLVQKFMYPEVDPVVHIYAPAGDDLNEHVTRVESYNARSDNPTHWQLNIHRGPDFLEEMFAEKPGNVVVLAGNNAKKTDYILGSVKAGINVLADKPMAITPADFEKLQQAFQVAASNHVLLYDIMTERFEITTMLQRALSQDTALFGQWVKGSPAEPAITKESVHHFSKTVSGSPLRRPQWFFDVGQEGEGIVDVTTHLVDLIQWEAFPEVVLDPSDANVLSARRWPTSITRDQFKKVTGADDFPSFLKKDVKDGVLQVYANGEFTYQLRGICARVSVTWNFEAPPGGGDTHYSVVRGTKAILTIRQGKEQEYKPVLYVEQPRGSANERFEETLRNAVAGLQTRYQGVDYQMEGNEFRITVPEKYSVGHEAHFAQVSGNFLDYLRHGNMPDWEVPNMITKYATIMKAYEMSR